MRTCCLHNTPRWPVAAWLLALLALGACQGPRALGQGAPLPTLAPTAARLATAAPATPLAAIPATVTPTPAATDEANPATATLALSQTATRTPRPAASPTSTPRPTLTPTAAPLIWPTIAATIPVSGTVDDNNMPIPTPVPAFELPDGVVNILLLGSDLPFDKGTPNTDTIIIASINTREQTAALLSLPRDMYVYIPGGRMGQINTVLHRENYPTGGMGRLKDAILYNFGIPIHYYVQVDFAGFISLVDAIGGVEVPVTCGLTDWRLKAPGLDITVEENYERFTLPAGVHHMDGDLALWYARSRVTTSDFDRSRRQQQILGALLQQGVELGLVREVPRLYTTYRESVRTDLDIGRILQLAAIAPAVRRNGIEHLNLIVGVDLKTYELAQFQHTVFLIDWANAESTFRRLLVEDGLNRSSRTPITVELRDGSGAPDMAALVADNLAWYGFVPVIGPTPDEPVARTAVTYYGANLKGSYDWLLRWPLDYRSEIRLEEPGPDRPFSYQVTIGPDHNPCRRHQNNPLRESIGADDS